MVGVRSSVLADIVVRIRSTCTAPRYGCLAKWTGAALGDATWKLCSELICESGLAVYQRQSGLTERRAGVGRDARVLFDAQVCRGAGFGRAVQANPRSLPYRVTRRDHYITPPLHKPLDAANVPRDQNHMHHTCYRPSIIESSHNDLHPYSFASLIAMLQ